MLGFLLGALLTGLATVLVGPVATVIPQPPETAVQRSEADPQRGQVSRQSPQSLAPLVPAVAAPASASGASRFQPPLAPPAPPVGVAGAELPPPAPRLSNEHAELLMPRQRDGQPLTLPELHLQLSTERPDLNWSLAMEQTLREFVMRSNGSGEFDVLYVECRSTLCEITLFGNLPASGQRWNSLLADMGHQPWGPQFQGQSTSFSGINGRTAIVSILQRARR
jgi:hypothetical protein